jgi:hypothetical protein
MVKLSRVGEPHRQLTVPKMEIPGRIYPGDIVFVGHYLKRIRVTAKVRPGVWDGINEHTGKSCRFKKDKVRGKSPMSPLGPTVYPRAQVIGLHAGCGGKVFFSPTRRTGKRYCDKCRSDGRFGRPFPTLDSEETE